ncbi:MAG: hypothetical protein QXG44_11355 [Candidatus Jordarchaeaceae archaeon]
MNKNFICSPIGENLTSKGYKKIKGPVLDRVPYVRPEAAKTPKRKNIANPSKYITVLVFIFESSI